MSIFIQVSLVSSHGIVINEGPVLEVLAHLIPPFGYRIRVAYPAQIDNPRVPSISLSS